jgi:hypothetical protein
MEKEKKRKMQLIPLNISSLEKKTYVPFSCENAKETYIILNFVPNFCYGVLFPIICPKGGIFGEASIGFLRGLSKHKSRSPFTICFYLIIEGW